MNTYDASNPKLPFEQLVTSGGDDRLDILSNGLNKYNIDPNQRGTTFSRASCTCSPFSSLGYEAAKSLYDQLSPTVFDEVRQRQTDQLKALINYEGQDRFHVFFAPSGSDLCYYPLMFSKLIRPEQDIFNVITCPEELGSGSNTAFSGRFFFDRNQFGDSVTKGAPLSPSLNIDGKSFPARDEHGTIIDHWQEIIDSIEKNYKSHSINANLVIGSKSGIENNVAIVSQTPEDVLWTVDLCQFRASRVLVNGLIGMNCSTMITGSKFYQSPPFCAVLLVPKTVCDQFKDPAPEIINPFAQVFSRHDIPIEFGGIRSHLRDFRNYGLLLRWEAAIAEMQAMAKLETHTVNRVISQWNELIVRRLSESKYFQLMPGQEITNKTIVSFRIKAAPDSFLDQEQLTNLYKRVCLSDVPEFENHDRVIFGQPVQYGDQSFVRIALGSGDVRNLVDNGNDFGDDLRLIKAIESVTEATFWN